MRPAVRAAAPVRALLLGLAMALCGCGGGSSSDVSIVGGGGTTPPVGATNAVAITVDGGPLHNYVNGLFATVTVCVHGTSTCKAIDHVLVDTGSYGLRLLYTDVSSLGLLPLTTGSSVVGECVAFADGSSLGTLSKADVAVGGEAISNLTIQVIGGPTTTTSATRPSSCGSGPAEDTLNTFGARGVLGVGVLRYDCGSACTTTPNGLTGGNPGSYMACSGGTCSPIAWPLASQVQNPVYFLATDNNGVVIQLTSPPGGVASTWTGTMYFGIGTQSDNALPASPVLLTTGSDTDPNPGEIRTVFPAGTAPIPAVIDTGSNALFFPPLAVSPTDPTVATDPPDCSNARGFYCPSSTLSLSGTQLGNNNISNMIAFSVGNANSLFANGAFALVPLGGDFGSGFFDWGLPFFFGRMVYFAAEGQSTPSGAGPYIGYAANGT